jgi:type I restriction enzyme M protein
MLDTLTKRRIDTARDILVGKLPDPKSQVEQITIALIYKFMDDMDKQSEELGGKTKFFTGEYEKYSWSKIFDPRVSGYELVALYGEAIQKMNYNPNIPQLFRNIFKNAYLPYRDPETLKMFLKVIGEFEYDYSEKLGDAFEYLLSIMSSQGDAGQFRTPRHIIDFMVEVVDPSKKETILDPACGTAGFLISSFNHIQNKNKKDGRINLTPDERARLIENLSGYDISPDMVRLSLVNMYLHGFQNPKIYEYDTLTSEERWNEFYDIILANPPFMSPKGGIRPHKRFSIQANRSEVLFVDYIAEHLNPNGRAGVIVPEGIIFQSGIAYKKLRKMLIENSLYAVVSLPAGVFNPYSGVKTSILFLNKNFAKKTDKILFVKINNDGFGLGAQRREVKENDLPLVLEIINKYKQSIIEGKEIEFDLAEAKLANVVKKEKIAESGDYNLSGDRYRQAVTYNGKWDFINLGSVCEFIGGYAFKSTELKKEKISDEYLPVIKIGNLTKEGKLNLESIQYYKYEDYLFKYLILQSDILVAMTGATVGKISVSQYSRLLLNQRVGMVRTAEDKINKNYLKNLLLSDIFYDFCQKSAGGGAQGNISPKEILSFEIPLPPLEIQEQIVAELDSYQKIVDGAKQVVENYKPTFKIDPEWEKVKVEELCNLVRGSSPRPKGDKKYYGGKIPRLMISDITRDGMYTSPKKDSLTEIGAKLSRPMKKGNVIMAVSGNPGLPTILAIDACIHDGFVGFKDLSSSILPEFLYFLLLHYKDTNNIQSIGAVFKNLNTNQVNVFDIPVPSIQVQKQIITKIEKEQKIIEGNKELITIFENKIKEKIAEVWGE